jgi:hypothetical protein
MRGASIVQESDAGQPSPQPATCKDAGSNRLSIGYVPSVT